MTDTVTATTTIATVGTSNDTATTAARYGPRDGAQAAFDLTTIGEGQIRLTCERGDRLASARHLRMSAAGSEANVAGLLSQLGRRTSWATKLPQGELTHRILSEYRSVGVDLSHVVLTQHGRVAQYFLEPGEYPLPGRVTYDRLYTPFRDIEPADFNWDSLLDTRVVFLTGITAALTQRTAEVVRYFADAAQERGIAIALDVNFRSLLWDGDQARSVLEPIARSASILFCSRADAQVVFGLTHSEGVQVCRSVRELLGPPVVVSTDAARGTYLSTAEGDQAFEIEQVPIVDRPGAGDSFVAGTLHGWLDGDVSRGIATGLRTASLALTHHGDLTRVPPGELDLALSGDIVR
ncbi:sugar kinase [Actinomyces sp. 2119]|uniref:Sugar kinase n=1 Tax=Actinomyces lilanjuaniae TaxID=2321394 RepID=A0ABM6Z3Y5_9ACTO|nr:MULTISPECIES: sugar kinase [Actinomyces]AYD90019.1 sugar kinase [Actinomyces lilanjuaniae]RJF42513.1 sugar kinase [Actinomyces sp. 2119]